VRRRSSRIWLAASLIVFLAAASPVSETAGREGGATEHRIGAYPAWGRVSPPAPPALRAPSALLLDRSTGRVLHGKGADLRRPVASLTKVMTALVVLDRVSSPSALVVVSQRAAAQSGSDIGLVAGERLSVRDLLYAALLQSSNDAALALAEHVAGSERAFVELMNRRARELRLTDTHFRSATGLDDRGYSTARQVAALFRVALGRPDFAEIVGTTRWQLPAVAGRPRIVWNRNLLLGTYPGATGGKTGFTTPAGYCLVASAELERRDLVAVVLGGPVPAFEAASALLDYGFDAFVPVALVNEGAGVGTFELEGHTVRAVAASDAERLVRIDRLDDIELRLTPRPDLTLPIAAREEVGTVELSSSGTVLATVSAVASAELPPPLPPSPAPGDRTAEEILEILEVVEAVVEAVAGGFL
jgi:serine-type D-Ala-D-Ala carboxypeptidase (penicillin-binding protein 5/6)